MEERKHHGVSTEICISPFSFINMPRDPTHSSHNLNCHGQTRIQHCPRLSQGSRRHARSHRSAPSHHPHPRGHPFCLATDGKRTRHRQPPDPLEILPADGMWWEDEPRCHPTTSVAAAAGSEEACMHPRMLVYSPASSTRSRCGGGLCQTAPSFLSPM